MKSTFCLAFLLACSAFAHAANYQLLDSSTFTTDAGTQALTGSFSADFAFGIPPNAANPVFNYHFEDFNLTAGNHTFRSMDFDEIYRPLLGDSEDNVSLPPGGIKPFLRPIYLEVIETVREVDFLLLNILSLTPAEYDDDTFSLVAVVNDGLPAYVQLGYDVRETLLRVELAPSNQLITLRDISLGRVEIFATPVPLPAACWFFASTILGIAGFKYRR